MNPSDPCPVELDRSLAALRMECHAISTVIEQMGADDLARPTRLADWNVQQLLAHLVRGVDRIRTYLLAPLPLEASVGWLDYWSAARASDPTAIAQRARDFAASINDRPVRRVWAEVTEAGVQEAEAEGPDRVLQGPFGGMRLDHYLTTRVFEVTVHGLDLREALGLEEVASPYALEVTAAVLDGLLGGPRPSDVADDPVAFILAATGRHEHADPSLPVVT